MNTDNTSDLPYKDDTSDGTTAAKTPDEIAEETADQVRSTDQLAREAADVPDPEEGHDVRDYRLQPEDGESVDPRNPGHPDFQPQAPEHVGDDAGVDQHGDEAQADEPRAEGGSLPADAVTADDEA